MTEPWQIDMLGGLQARQQDRCITRFRTHKNGALLAYLAYHSHRAHPRELLVELLWPEIEPRVGRHRLCQALYSLRLQLEPSGTPPGAVIAATRLAVRLNPEAIATDVTRFEQALAAARRTPDPGEKLLRLTEAAALYQGELLPGYFEEWIVPERQRLEELHQRAVQELSRLRETLEDRPEAPQRLESEPTHSDREAADQPLAGPGLPAPEPRGHLPLQLTRFFGREPEIERLQALLQDEAVRLVTVTGPGGTGKTRLAIQAAQRLQPLIPGGAWFVPLLDLADPGLIPDQILATLREPRSLEAEPLEQAVRLLSRQPVLLVLDNYEHLVDGGAEIARALLERVPGLTLLVTSRRCLNLDGEHLFPILPLPTPASDFDPERLQACESVRLFVDRAQMVRPDFGVTPGNGAAVASLCQRLEGLPLALELAAARAGVFSIRQMLARLRVSETPAPRFELLEAGRRTADPRHHGLRAALDWSYRLLSPELQQFFARLSVFRGGWSAEAAEAVCGPPETPGRAARWLEQLQAASMLQAYEGSLEMRFRMLETLREFAAEQLTAIERAALAQRHAEYYLSLAETGLPQPPKLPAEVWYARVAAETDNLRAALAWAAEAGAEPEGEAAALAGLRLAGRLFRSWESRGQWFEGRGWLERLLALPGAAPRTAERARALFGLAVLVNRIEEHETALTIYAQSLAIWRELGEQAELAQCLVRTGNLYGLCDRHESARALLDEALSIYQALGYSEGATTILHSLGGLAFRRGDLDEASRLWGECAARSRAAGQPPNTALGNLSIIARYRGEIDQARRLLEECFEIERQTQQNQGNPGTLGALGETAYYQGDLRAAADYWEQALPLSQRQDHIPTRASPLDGLGRLARLRGELEQARAYFKEALAIVAELSPESVARGENMGRLWMGLARVLCDQGDLAEARSAYRESISWWQRWVWPEALPRFGPKVGIADCLDGLAVVAAKAGQYEQAARVLAAALAVREPLEVRPAQPEAEERKRCIETVRAQLGEEWFTAAWSEGRAMSLEQAVRLALGDP